MKKIKILTEFNKHLKVLFTILCCINDCITEEFQWPVSMTAMTNPVTTKNENLFLPSRVTRYELHIK